MHLLGDEVVEGMGNIIDGDFAPAAKNLAIGLVFKRLGPLSGRLTFLYQKLGPAGQHLKFGIASNPAMRYTSAELAGGRLKILTSGSRQDMLRLERNLHETLPIGSEERQMFYIQKQIEKGLTPPPYP